MSDRGRDVVVVGGGPAGSALACFMALRGRDVLVLDAARFPRDKVCGESVSPGAWPLLDAMGAAERVASLHPHPVRGMRLVSPDGTAFRGEYRGQGRPGFALRRLALDAALLDTARSAGADVREGVRVTGLLREGGAVGGVLAEEGGGSRPIRARATVGADGRRSVVARSLGLLRENPRMRRFAVRGHWDGIEALSDVGEMHGGGGGYCGVAPLSPALANVTFVLDKADLVPAGADLEGFYRDALHRFWPRLAERLGRARLLEPPRAIGPLALDCDAVAAPGAVLVGDAAGFYDPFTGEGITLALRTADLAAREIDKALARPGTGPVPRLAGYERARAAATRDKFRFNRLVQVAVGWPAAANAIARRLARRPDLADRLVGVAGDFLPARTVLGPGFAWSLLTA
ncbi:MAG TPA: NAD(P)/FAD-dependent oxidoreductase [Vicinamibacteria bacterium]|nr:NAD(P)/FAD-dependent oxidoreductase [Vicinamibacteria bacterium]